jgi:L-glutamine-phosphate cytidylyltransferase
LKAIILAAGTGTRLSGATVTPKCLVEVGGMSLVRRQIRSLRQAEITQIVVVVGFEAHAIRSHCGEGIEFVENPRFAETSSLYSLWLARHHLKDGFVVLNCDVLFHPHLLEALLASPHADALLVSYRRDGQEPLGAEEMKVKVREDLVVDISKELNPSDADGENVGIVKFGGSGAELLVECMDDLIARGLTDAWAPRAFLEFAGREKLYAVSTGDYPWIEIDFPEDYQRAVREIYPAIEADR